MMNSMAISDEEAGAFDSADWTLMVGMGAGVFLGAGVVSGRMGETRGTRKLGVGEAVAVGVSFSPQAAIRRGNKMNSTKIVN